MVWRVKRAKTVVKLIFYTDAFISGISLLSFHTTWMMRRADSVLESSGGNPQRFLDAFKHSLDSAFLEWQTTTRPEFDDSVYESPD